METILVGGEEKEPEGQRLSIARRTSWWGRERTA